MLSLLYPGLPFLLYMDGKAFPLRNSESQQQRPLHKRKGIACPKGVPLQITKPARAGAQRSPGYGSKVSHKEVGGPKCHKTEGSTRVKDSYARVGVDSKCLGPGGLLQ